MPISQITGASIQDGSIVVADLGITTFNTGTGNTLTLQANSATGLVISVTGNTAIANSLSFSSTGARITGDFSTGTFANRVAFQTSTTNSQTSLTVLPNGTNVNSSLGLFDNSDPTNAGRLLISQSTTSSSFTSGITGTGSYVPMTFVTGGSERLRIDTSGNVGIGTTSTTQRFNVRGGRSVFQANSDLFSLQIEGASGAGQYYIGATNEANPSLVFSNVGGVERARIDTAGNIGIGTASPSQKLHVAAGTILASNTSSTTATVSIAGNGSTTGTSDFSLQQGTSSEAYVFNRANSFLVLGTNNTERMRITSGGNVGIGTSSPSQALHVAASIRCDGDVRIQGTLSNSVSSGPCLFLGNTAGDRFWNAQHGADNQLLFGYFNGSAWTERMRITSGGDVGIGTSSPQVKLDVRGNFYVNNSTSNQGDKRAIFQTITGVLTSAASGVAKSIAYVFHNHCVRIFISVSSLDNNCSGGTFIGSSNFVCGSGLVTQEATQTFYSGSGTNLSSISVTYQNGSGDNPSYPNYIIRVTNNYTGTTPIIWYTIQGIAGDTMVAIQN